MTDLNEIPIVTITGAETSLAEYGDKVKLIVNVASRCGLAPQYEKLEDLQKTYGDRGFTVLGFPSNQFLQELGTEEKIAEYCSTTWGVTFPMFERIKVNGRGEHPLYTELKKAQDADGQGRAREVELREIRGHARRPGAPLPPRAPNRMTRPSSPSSKSRCPLR